MNRNQKIDMVGRIIMLSDDCPGYEDDFVALIRKVVGPEPAPPATTNVLVQPADATATELLILKNQGKIPAIKAYRQRVPCLLKEAKDQIENDGLRTGILFVDDNGYIGTKEEVEKNRAYREKELYGHARNSIAVVDNTPYSP